MFIVNLGVRVNPKSTCFDCYFIHPFFSHFIQINFIYLFILSVFDAVFFACFFVFFFCFIRWIILNAIQVHWYKKQFVKKIFCSISDCYYLSDVSVIFFFLLCAIVVVAIVFQITFNIFEFVLLSHFPFSLHSGLHHFCVFVFHYSCSIFKFHFKTLNCMVSAVNPFVLVHDRAIVVVHLNVIQSSMVLMWPFVVWIHSKRKISYLFCDRTKRINSFTLWIQYVPILSTPALHKWHTNRTHSC